LNNGRPGVSERSQHIDHGITAIDPYQGGAEPERAS